MLNRKNLFVMFASMILLCFLLIGCSADDDYDHESKDIKVEGNEVQSLVLIEKVKIEGTNLHQFILYDPSNFIMYSYVEWVDGGGFVEMHNIDGSPRIYNPVK